MEERTTAAFNPLRTHTQAHCGWNELTPIQIRNRSRIDGVFAKSDYYCVCSFSFVILSVFVPIEIHPRTTVNTALSYGVMVIMRIPERAPSVCWQTIDDWKKKNKKAQKIWCIKHTCHMPKEINSATRTTSTINNSTYTHSAHTHQRTIVVITFKCIVCKICRICRGQYCVQ